MTGFGFALLLREVWCHWYYPVRGRLYWRWNQPELAAVAWRAYLHTPTLCGRRRKRSARLFLAHCLWRLDDPGAALAECERLLALRCEPCLAGLAQLLRADCLGRLGRPTDEPVPELELPSGEGAEEALYARELEVDRRERDGDWRGALAQLEGLVSEAIDAGNDAYLLGVRLRLAQARLRYGYWEAAMLTAESILGRRDLSPMVQHDAYIVAARAYLELERLDQAQHDAEQALRIADAVGEDEKRIDDLLTLGEVAVQRGDFVGAMRFYQQVREAGGNGRWLASMGEGELLALWGRHAEARLAFDQAERNLPADGDLHRTAAQLLAVDRALTLALHDTSRAAEPLLACPLDRLPDPRLQVKSAAYAAWVLTGAGYAAEAEPFVARFTAGRDEFVHDRHLQADIDLATGEIARAQGDLTAAAAAFRAALDRPCAPMIRPLLALRLGDALAAAGDDAGAREAWTTAADCPHEVEAVLDARRRLGR